MESRSQHFSLAVWIILTKLLYAIKIYYFCQFIMIRLQTFTLIIKQEKNHYFITAFMFLYLFERVFLTYFIKEKDSKRDYICKLIIYKLLHIEEIILLRDSTQGKIDYSYHQTQIFYYLPLDIILFIWTVMHQSNLMVILFSVNLFLFFQACHFRYTKNYFNYTNPRTLFNLIRVHLFSAIHFISYIWLFQMNIRLNLFGLFYLLLFIVLASVYYYFNVLGLKKKEKYKHYFIKLFVHIVFDKREFKQTTQKQAQYFSKHDKLTIFFFIMKLYLLLEYSCQLNNQLKNNTELSSFCYFLLTISILSAIIILIQFFKNKQEMSEQHQTKVRSNVFNFSCIMLFKVSTAIKLFFFVQFIQVYLQIIKNNYLTLILTIKQEKNSYFTYIFLGFYILQRLITAGFEIKVSKKIKLCVLLNLLQTDEFLMHKYSDQINKFLFLINQLSMPLDIITLIWTLNYLSYLNIILQIINLIAFFSLFFCSAVSLREQTYEEKVRLTKKYTQNFLKEYISAIIHFTSYICLIYFHFTLNLSGLYILVAHFIFIVALGIGMRKIRKYESKIKYIKQYSSYVHQQLIHIIIDDQDSIYYGRFIDYYQLSNIQNIYSLVMKLYLLLVLVIQYDQIIDSTNNEIYIFSVILVIVSAFSIILFIYKLSENSSLEINRKSYYIFAEYENFEYQANNEHIWFSKLKKGNKSYKHILIQNMSVENKTFIFQSLCFRFPNSEIFSPEGRRYYLSQGKQEVYIEYNVSNNSLLRLIQNQKLLPEINKMTFTKSNIKVETYQKLVEILYGVLIISYYGNKKVYHLNLNLFSKINQISAQYKVFQRQISDQQIINPLLLFYDLYDDQSQSNNLI